MVVEGGLPDSGECKVIEREKKELGTRGGETTCEIFPAPVIVESCLKYNKDKLLMGKGHIVNFMSSDCVFDSKINRKLVNANMIAAEKLKAQNPKIGETVVFAHNGRYIFNVVMKNKTDDKPFLNNISRGIMSLKEAMIPLKVQCIKFSKIGNGLDKISWSSIDQIIHQYFCENGLREFICSGEIRIPEKSDRSKIIKEAHESTIGGHKGVSKTFWRIRADYYWNKLKSDVQQYVKHCRKCQENKLVRVKTRQPMQISDTPTPPFERIQIDNFSKYADAIPIPTIDSTTVATALAEQFISRYGCPRIIHTDQGTNFTSNIMKTFCKIFKIDQHFDRVPSPISRLIRAKSSHPGRISQTVW